MSKMKFLHQGFQKLEPEQVRHTNTRMRPNALPRHIHRWYQASTINCSMRVLLCFAVTLQMMKWQPAVETVRNSDGTDDYVHLFDKVRQLDTAEKKVANLKPLQLFDHPATFIDEVLIANCCFTMRFWK